MREGAGRNRDTRQSERQKVFAHDFCSFGLGPLRRAGKMHKTMVRRISIVHAVKSALVRRNL
jgi:hypothetical protein